MKPTLDAVQHAFFEAMAENLPTTEASVLAQGETPAVIIGAYFMLGEQLTFVQWTGVFISLFGAWYLSRWLAKKPESTNQTKGATS